MKRNMPQTKTRMSRSVKKIKRGTDSPKKRRTNSCVVIGGKIEYCFLVNGRKTWFPAIVIQQASTVHWFRVDFKRCRRTVLLSPRALGTAWRHRFDEGKKELVDRPIARLTRRVITTPEHDQSLDSARKIRNVSARVSTPRKRAVSHTKTARHRSVPQGTNKGRHKNCLKIGDKVECCFLVYGLEKWYPGTILRCTRTVHWYRVAFPCSKSTVLLSPQGLGTAWRHLQLTDAGSTSGELAFDDKPKDCVQV